MVTQRTKYDEGSATVLSLGLSAATVVFGGAIVATLHMMSLAQEVQQVANLAALAASDVAMGVAPGIPCRVSRAIVAKNGFELSSCELDGHSARVSVASSQWGVPISRRAHAAPQPSALWGDLTPGQ